ncbi:hypothetical protein NPIL_38061 [Nephila pilipes]|uniref:Uncharacterized protein n=1 Tax=Nephila pilipes TaxID=299642 RepID=A0A8X6PJV5_NEPPI|nr:hypothetical protein NPIL_38061 [Nephila pilipes]
MCENPLVEIKPDSRIERLLSDTKSRRLSLRQCSTPRVEREGRNDRQIAQTLPFRRNGKEEKEKIRPSLQSVGDSALSSAFFRHFLVDFGVIFETPDSDRF